MAVCAVVLRLSMTHCTAVVSWVLVLSLAYESYRQDRVWSNVSAD